MLESPPKGQGPKRSARVAVMEHTNGTGQTIRFGAFDVDPRSGELRKSGTRIRLQEQPFKVLLALLERPGEVVSRDELRRRIWPEESFGDFDHAVSVAVGKLRTALGDSPEIPRFVETLHGRGYRFVYPLSVPTEQQAVEAGRPTLGQPKETSAEHGLKKKWVLPVYWRGIAVALATITIPASAVYLYPRRAPVLHEKDTIVLADFANKTGDAVFEGTLREGLSVQLDQSPFISSISDQQVQQTLQMMGRRRDTSLTPEIAREVCQRTNSSAVVEGSIALIGKQYSLILKAVDCSTGESLASTQVQVGDKNEVLNGLGKSASDLRRRLGESRVTVEKFDAPLSQATTPSLEALQAYTLARKQFERGVPDDAIPFLKRAIELDPNFAVAYAALGADYANKDRELSTKYATKAFELSGNVSEHERLYISAVYYGAVTGELDKEIETLKLMTQTYPRDAWARFRLGSAYERAGELAPAVEEYRVAVSLDSQRPQCRNNFVSLLLALNHLDEAKTAFEEAISNKTDDMDVHVGLYRIAYFRKDASGMQHELDWAAGNPDEFRLVEEQSEIALYEGRLERARELLQKSNDLAARRRLNTEIPLRTARHASYRALLGDCHEVRGNVPSTVTASSDTPALMTARALTFAVCGDKKQAQELIEEMIARFPKDSVTQSVRVPIVRAAVAIKDGNPDAAVEALRPAAPYENRYPGIIYFRGQACLQAHKAKEAEAEFQRVLGYSPVVGERVGAIARLGLARAYVLGGDVAKAKAAYQDFLTFWKDADPDIQILNQAKAEYKTLH